MATGIFTYAKPKILFQKNHNKEALAILETKRYQLIPDGRAISSGYIPQRKLKQNFLHYYTEYVKSHIRTGNGHLQKSPSAFKAFLDRDYISPTEITETVC